MGITEEQLWSMTPRSFSNLIKGWRKRHESDQRERWEMVRAIVVSGLRPHLHPKDMRKPTDQLYPLPWDHKGSGKSPKKEKLTAEEVKSFLKKSRLQYE